MKLLFIPVFLITLAACEASAVLTDSMLQGCWRSEKVTSHLSDGTSLDGNAQCSLMFDSSRIISTCSGSNGPFSITYSYKIVAAGKYEAEIIRHDTMPRAVGSKRTYEYQVSNGHLLITTYPQTTSPAPLNAAVKVVSTSSLDSQACPSAK